MLTTKSMLSYPGGKSRAVKLITPYFPKDMTEMCSPFFGGGSIELAVAAQGVQVHGYDIFSPLVEFWQTIQHSPSALADEINKYSAIVRDEFYALQKANLSTSLERAGAFFALNKSSFSGSTYSGGFSSHNSRKRLTANAINRVRNFHNPNFTVDQLDFQQSITKHNCFLYLDPPYLINEALYGNKGNTHKGFDHQTLREILSQRDNWVMSYNDSSEIRAMYQDCQIIKLDWKYGMSNNTSAASEILIIKGAP